MFPQPVILFSPRVIGQEETWLIVLLWLKNHGLSVCVLSQYCYILFGLFVFFLNIVISYMQVTTMLFCQLLMLMIDSMVWLNLFMSHQAGFHSSWRWIKVCCSGWQSWRWTHMCESSPRRKPLISLSGSTRLRGCWIRERERVSLEEGIGREQSNLLLN